MPLLSFSFFFLCFVAGSANTNGNARAGGEEGVIDAASAGGNPGTPSDPSSPQQSRLLLEQTGVAAAAEAAAAGLNGVRRSTVSLETVETVAPASDTLPVAEGIPIGVVGGLLMRGDGVLPSPGSVASSSLRAESVTSTVRTSSDAGGAEAPYRRRVREPSSFK